MGNGKLCDVKRCRHQANISYVWEGFSANLCPTHLAKYCDMPGTDSVGNMKKLIGEVVK